MSRQQDSKYSRVCRLKERQIHCPCDVTREPCPSEISCEPKPSYSPVDERAATALPVCESYVDSCGSQFQKFHTCGAKCSLLDDQCFGIRQLVSGPQHKCGTPCNRGKCCELPLEFKTITNEIAKEHLITNKDVWEPKVQYVPRILNKRKTTKDTDDDDEEEPYEGEKEDQKDAEIQRLNLLTQTQASDIHELQKSLWIRNTEIQNLQKESADRSALNLRQAKVCLNMAKHFNERQSFFRIQKGLVENRIHRVRQELRHMTKILHAPCPLSDEPLSNEREGPIQVKPTCSQVGDTEGDSFF